MRTRTDRDVYTEAIDRLVDNYGSYERFALILNVSAADLYRWARGRARPPTDVFLKILDLNEASWKR
jgi:DNA-binding transcriptional regulator YiaG